MQNFLRITLYTLCLTLVVCNPAFPAKVALPKTGQTVSYATGDDGALKKGIAWPNPRFTDNGDGTVKDNLTGLVWLKNANCSATLGGVVKSGAGLAWANAITWSNNLASGSCGLTDGSVAGQWRLPSINELSSLIDISNFNPALPTGFATYFSNIDSIYYWSGSTYAGDTTFAWCVYMFNGHVRNCSKANGCYGIFATVWPVRAGQ